MHQAKSNRFYSRAGQSAVEVAQNRTTSLHVNGHAKQGIDHAKTISTGCLYSFCDAYDVRYIRGQLHNHRQVRVGFNGAAHSSSAISVNTKGHTAVLNVRTANVNFETGYAFNSNRAGDFCVIFYMRCRDVGQNRHIVLAKQRQNIRYKRFSTWVFQADTVQNTRRRFRNTRTRITVARFRR